MCQNHQQKDNLPIYCLSMDIAVVLSMSQNIFVETQQIEGCLHRTERFEKVLRGGSISKLFADARDKDPISTQGSWTCKN